MHALNNEKLVLISAFYLLITALVVSFRRKKTEPAINFLSAYFWFYFYTMALTYMASYSYIVEFPHLFRTGFLVSLLMMPASFLYIRQSLFPKKLGARDLVHLIPFLIYVIDYHQFFLISADQKVALIRSYSQQELTAGYSEGLFMPRYFYYTIRYVQVGVYFVIQWRIISKAQWSPEHPVAFGNPGALSWMKILVGSQPVLVLIPLIGSLISGLSAYWTYSIFGGAIVALAQSYYLFFHPEMLYGITGVVPSRELPELEEDQVDDKENDITEDVLDETGTVLDEYMKAEKAYLRGKFKLQELAAATGLPVYRISAYVNRRKNMNFSNYLNHYRVQECISKMHAGEHQVKTLEALAEECGFQNRTTFIRVFKQVTGKTPSQFSSEIPVSFREI